MFRRACGRSSLGVQSRLPGARVLADAKGCVAPAYTLHAAITPTVVTSPFATQQIRGAWWNGKSDAEKQVEAAQAAAIPKTPAAAAPAEPVQEMPDMTASQPVEVDDYIRPDKTIFEKAEDGWDWLTNYFSPSELVADTMMSLHNHGALFGLTGALPWPAVLLGWGCLMRACCLPFNLYAARNAVRMNLIQGPMREIREQMEITRKDKSLSSAEKKLITAAIKRKRKAIEQKTGCAMWKAGIVMFSSPFLVSSFMAVRTLCTYEETLETERFLWIKDLTVADPLVILPTACTFLFIANMEATMAVNAGGRGNMSIWMKYGGRVAGVLMLYFVLQHQPAAMFCYWIGMSLVGLANPWLQAHEGFRKYWNFPPRPQRALEKEKETPLYKMMVKMGLKKEVVLPEVKEQMVNGNNGANSSNGSTSSSSSKGSGQHETIHDYEILEEEDDKTVRAMKSGGKVANATR